MVDRPSCGLGAHTGRDDCLSLDLQILSNMTVDCGTLGHRLDCRERQHTKGQTMTRFMAAVAALGLSCAAVSDATAQTYGTPDGGCEQAAGYPVNDAAIYFDGATIGGQGWSCQLTPAGDAYVGLCQDESGDAPVQVTFTIVSDSNTVTITSDADDEVYTLRRCR